jgi:hypothetical protein
MTCHIYKATTLAVTKSSLQALHMALQFWAMVKCLGELLLATGTQVFGRVTILKTKD